jgi:dienelactone hydrolase
MPALTPGPSATQVEHTVIDVDGCVVDVTVAGPVDRPVRSALVLHPDIMGLRPLFDDLAARLASHGVAVITIEPWFTWTADVRSARAGGGDRMPFVRELDDDRQLRALEVARDEIVRRHPGLPVDLMGFCMGGMYTLKAAATGWFRRHVAFYGMVRVPETWHGPGQRDALATAERAGPTLAVFGGIDQWSPPVDIDDLRSAWQGRDDCQVVVYPDADHAFVHDPERATHRADDAADAWSRALRFLGVDPSTT